MKRGFTLIELSIVLVIIGLIVGGILVGQDLIQAAAIRGTVSQFEKYMTSVNTFRIKYGYLPGDMPSARAAQLGFFAESGPSAGTAGHQDGNGLIDGGSAGGVLQLGETIGIWRHLSDAQMIDGSFGTQGAALLDPATGGVTAPLVRGTSKLLYPQLKLGRGGVIAIMNNYPRNQFHTRVMNAVAVNGSFSGTSGITSLEAQEIDVKMDDGMPWTGKVTGNGDPDVTCVTSTGLYLVGAGQGDFPGCTMDVDF